MRIGCPFCGERGVEEYVFHGDASLRRPREGAPETAWTDYVYLRENPNGLYRELWYHAAGCHAWLVVTRDLGSHVISDVVAARDVA